MADRILPVVGRLACIAESLQGLGPISTDTLRAVDAQTHGCLALKLEAWGLGIEGRCLEFSVRSGVAGLLPVAQGGDVADEVQSP